jgi:putative endonuclease
MKGQNKTFGREGEEIAVELLLKKNYTILERNYQLKKGEIDIIAEDPNGDLVFLEVKFRNTLDFGEPEYAITPSKQKQVRKVAEAYIYYKDIYDQTCRFDVICITNLPGMEEEIIHYEDAFR